MSLPDDVLNEIKDYAESHSVSMGKATAELVRRGLSRPAPTHIVNGLRFFSAPTGAPKITLEMVKELDSEQDIEKVLPYLRGSKR
jgi:hypothetical protein